jgi:hypothetical protein
MNLTSSEGPLRFAIVGPEGLYTDSSYWWKSVAKLEILGTAQYALAVDSSPTGVNFTVDGASHTTSWLGIYGDGSSVSLVMPETHDGYVWFHWLEDGDTNRTKTIVLTGDTTLTGVFRFLADLNGDGTINIHDIVIAALGFGSKPGDPNWNPIADIRQDGIINIIDLVMVAIHFGETYP